ncbi:MAG: hypothetical protein ACN4G0_14215 [Polyangiales bacterium]
MRIGAGAAALGMVVGLIGCGDDGVGSLPYELSCNITDSNCQRTIYDSLAVTLGAEGFDRPQIRTISVAQHAQEVRSGLDLNDLTGEDAATRGLRLMGFIPEDTGSLAETQAEFWITQVAAYYQRGSHLITVVDRDYEVIGAQTLLAHELTHAIQHSQFDLGTVGVGADTEDAVLGVRGVIEGDAMHSSFAWTYEKLGYLPEEIDWNAIFEEDEALARDDAADSSVALVDSASGFPYSYGFDYMRSVFVDGGLVGRAAAFVSPPSSTIEHMLGFGAPLPAFDFPEAAHPSPVDGHSVEGQDRFGAWYVYGFLRRRGMSDTAAWSAALSWLGDELAIYESDSSLVAVWRVRFDQALNASVLADEVNSDPRDVAWSAVLFEDDAYVFAAENEQTLLAWADQPLDSPAAVLAQ